MNLERLWMAFKVRQLHNSETFTANSLYKEFDILNNAEELLFANGQKYLM